MTGPDPSGDDVVDSLRERLDEARDEAQALEPLVAEAGKAARWHRLRRFWPLLLLATIAGSLLASGVLDHLNLENLQAHHGTLQAWAQAWPLLTRLALWLTIATLIVTGLPGSPLMAVVGGLLFGTIEGAVWSVLGDTTGAIVLYALTRRTVTGGPAKPGALIGRLKAGFLAHPTSYCLFLRVVPVFPFTATSIALAWLGCRFRTYVWTTAAGLVPTAVVYSAIGAGFELALKEQRKLSLDLLSEPRFLWPLVGVGVLALLPVVFGVRRKG